MSSDPLKPTGWSPFTASLRDAYPGQIIVGRESINRRLPMHEYEAELRQQFSRHLEYLQNEPVVTVQIPVDGKRGVDRPINYFGFFSPQQTLPPTFGGLRNTHIAINSEEETLESISTRSIDRAFLKTLRELHIPEPMIVTCTFKDTDALPPYNVTLTAFKSSHQAKEFRAAMASDAFSQVLLTNVEQDRQSLHERLGQRVDIDWFERLRNNQIVQTEDKDNNPYFYFIATDANAPTTYDPHAIKYRHHPLSPTDVAIVEACLIAHIQAPDIQAQYTADNQFLGMAYLFTRDDQARQFQDFISDPQRVADAIAMLDTQVERQMASRAADRAPTANSDDAPAKGPSTSAQSVAKGGVVAGATSRLVH